MIYFDSDVLFNYLVIQDNKKHEQAKKLVLTSIEKLDFTISTLTIQEVGYGLAGMEFLMRKLKRN